MIAGEKNLGSSKDGNTMRGQGETIQPTTFCRMAETTVTRSNKLIIKVYLEETKLVTPSFAPDSPSLGVSITSN